MCPVSPQSDKSACLHGAGVHAENLLPPLKLMPCCVPKSCCTVTLGVIRGESPSNLIVPDLARNPNNCLTASWYRSVGTLLCQLQKKNKWNSTGTSISMCGMGLKNQKSQISLTGGGGGQRGRW